MRAFCDSPLTFRKYDIPLLYRLVCAPVYLLNSKQKAFTVTHGRKELSSF